MGTFAEDVVVRRLDAGRFAADLDDSWNIVRFPQGGVVAALGLRAAEAEIGDPGRSRSAPLRAVAHGVGARPRPRARWADAGWASLESMLWDEAGVPVGYATQMSLFTYL